MKSLIAFGSSYLIVCGLIITYVAWFWAVLFTLVIVCVTAAFLSLLSSAGSALGDAESSKFFKWVAISTMAMAFVLSIYLLVQP